tara:strand:- start:1716 stop:2117 length:402 start_codon:yes stop_codon:yes gene_type:complete
MNEDKDPLEITIQDLAQDKQDVVSQEARQAKERYDELKDRLDDPSLIDDDDVDFHESMIDIDSFNDNVKLLLAVFKNSKFDEFIYLLGKPQKLFMIHCLLGFFKGVGFTVGVILVLSIIIYVFGGPTLLALLR